MLHIGLLLVGLLILFVYVDKIVYRSQLYDIAMINTNSQLDMIPLDYVKFNGGDLLWFMYDCSQCNRQEFVNMIITCNPWPSVFSHIGIVIEIDGQQYIAHKTYCEEFDSNNVCKVNKSGFYPLRKYLKEYHGYVYHSRAKKPIADVNIPRLLSYNNREFVVDQTTVFDYLMLTDIKNRKEKTMSCSGYVRQILVDSDLLKPMNGNHTTPSGIYNETVKANLYAKPNIVINDYLNNKVHL
jgi:hypothetical protein